MTAILISRAHDWRYTGDGWYWGDGEGWDALKRKGYDRRECMTCGRVESLPTNSKVPCKRHGEHPDSGWSGVLVDCATGRMTRRRQAA